MLETSLCHCTTTVANDTALNWLMFMRWSLDHLSLTELTWAVLSQ